MGEKCGIFGVYGKGLEAARLVLPGLWSLQHRGQESSGISATDGRVIRTHKGTGLVAHVYGEKDLDKLPGHIAIGHNRYGTSSRGNFSHSQPVTDSGGLFALAHNGNLPSTKKIEKFLASCGIDTTPFNDSEMMYAAIRYYVAMGENIEKAVVKTFDLFTGVFSLLIMTNNKLIALRDVCGIRPLSIGQLNGGYVFSSETCALDTIGASFIRDISPGEMVTVDDAGLNSIQIRKGNQKLDIFEFVYFARPDSILLGKCVNQVRQDLGRKLAKEKPVNADVVVPVPDSAIPAALGYSEESGIPFDHGLIKNRYIHRTFIRPDQKLRERDARLKLNPLPSVLKNKKVIVVDDSIVRGTNAKQLVRMIKDAGAKEVHLAISSPPVRFPDFYGIDTPVQKNLIASQMSITKIADHVGADSVNYLSYKGLIGATGLPEKVLCTSCFTGIYPLDILDRAEGVSYSFKTTTV